MPPSVDHSAARTPRRLLRAACAALGLVLALAVPGAATSAAGGIGGAAGATTAGAAGLTLSGTLFTPPHIDASTRYVLYYLQMHTGADSEVFSVSMNPPPFATIGDVREGQSVDGPTAIALQGPGRLGKLVQAPSVIVACSSRQSAFHGYATGPAAVDVMLPADAATTLAVRYAVGRRAPWVDSDFRLTFIVQGHLVGRYGAASPFASASPTVTGSTSVTTGGPIVQGATGAHILLTTVPAGTPGAPYAPRAISRAQGVSIGGRLLPADAGLHVLLQWARGDGALHTLAKLTTGPGGVLPTEDWHPTQRGTYDLWASYPRQPGGLAADSTSCPLRFQAS